MIVNILKTLPWYFAGLVILAAPAILLIISLFMPLGAENYFFGSDWVANKFMDIDGVEDDGLDRYIATADFNLMFAWLNITLLITTFIFSFGWSLSSHFLNIDEPGKAKFFGLPWIIVTAVCIAAIAIICYIILNSSAFFISQYITKPSEFWIVLLSSMYYGLMFWLAVIFGTARQARSAVLLANKLPARNFL